MYKKLSCRRDENAEHSVVKRNQLLPGKEKKKEEPQTTTLKIF